MDTTPTSTHHTNTSIATPALRRIDDLDALRGFALCGVLLVNIAALVRATPAPPGRIHPVATALELLVQHRFLPIFAFLFGVGFILFLNGPAQRAPRPRLLLIRRLIALFVIGMAHETLLPAEPLRYYALWGLLVLLPASYLPRPVLLGLAVITVPAGILGPPTLGNAYIPSLLLLGMTAARYRLPATLGRRTSTITIAFLVLASGAVIGTIWQAEQVKAIGDLTDERTIAIGTAVGLLGAGAYLTGMCLLLQTRARAALVRALAPLGRTALTNFIGASLACTVFTTVAGLAHQPPRWGVLLTFAVTLLTIQAAASAWWLRRFHHGPLEWAWRAVTWWDLPPLRRNRPTRAHHDRSSGSSASNNEGI